MELPVVWYLNIDYFPANKLEKVAKENEKKGLTIKYTIELMMISKRGN